MKKLIIFILIVFAGVFFAMSATRAFDIGKLVGTSIVGIEKMAKASKNITPAEEYYIGRAVAAMVIAKYPLVQKAALTKYLNEVGLLVAYASDKPETYGGYHFGVVRSSQINAFACPGGFIFVTTGLLDEVKNEDQLAAILGHEVAHVAHEDALSAIKRSKWTDFAFFAAGQAAGHFSPSEVKELTNVFSSVISDVGKKVIDSGYSQSQEKRADADGVRYASRAGYDPNGLVTLLEEEIQKGTTTAGGPYSSHPKPQTRVKLVKSEIEKERLSHPIATIRTKRYKRAVARK